MVRSLPGRPYTSQRNSSRRRQPRSVSIWPAFAACSIPSMACSLVMGSPAVEIVVWAAGLERRRSWQIALHCLPSGGMRLLITLVMLITACGSDAGSGGPADGGPIADGPADRPIEVPPAPAALGEACTEDGGCLSGICADNVCCS